MRTIKFRGKSLNNGEWVVGNYIGFPTSDEGSMCSYIKPDVYCVVEVDSYTVGQFTGLLDKNGKEIYEGDILLIAEERDDEYGKMKIHNAVGIKNGCFGYIGENTGELLPFCDKKITERIVGNIHDNPELLKGDKQ